MSSKAATLTLSQRLGAYIQLTRFDKPIGTELLLWPTFWAVWIAANGRPGLKVVLIMLAGVVLMRAAGCAINDYADRKIDGGVARTAQRPLARGVISAKEALIVFAILVMLSASLLLFLPVATFYWSLGAVALATLYPFMKRVTYLPQLVLGAAFSWSIPMAYAAQGQLPDTNCWLLYAANVCWTVAYDTQYAMSDREEDIKIGVKSSAILFGRYDLKVVALLQLVTLGLLAWVFFRLQLLPVAGLGLLISAGLFVNQWVRTRQRQPAQTFWAFRNNRWVGLLIWLSVVLAYLIR